VSWQRATRSLKYAGAEDLANMRDAAQLLIDHERQINPRVLTDLCLIREETSAELRRRTHAVNPDTEASQRRTGGRQTSEGPAAT
jgi:hypothetical protein